jgi:virginiamycin B lyase
MAGTKRAAAAAVLLTLLSNAAAAQPRGPVVEYAIPWPGKAAAKTSVHQAAIGDGSGPARLDAGAAAHAAHPGSTHEIAVDPARGGGYWVSGQNYDHVAHVGEDGRVIRFYDMGAGSRPHGLAFDRDGKLWATLEGTGRIVRIDPERGIAESFPVTIPCEGCATPLNPHPHGLAIGADGRTLWFTGKATGTVGRVAPGGRVSHFQLPTAGSTPIYAIAGPDGAMWVTELTGNMIARVTEAGRVEEVAIPTPLARPIAVAPGPDGAVWFSEEAGGRVGRIDKGPDGKWRVVELALPRAQPNLILAGLAFDRNGDLWVQQYVSNNAPEPAGTDWILRIGRKGLEAWARSGGAERAALDVAYYPAPTAMTVMHRITNGGDGAMWFTEMWADRLGRVAAD